jgi:hypothetical protein
VKDEYVLTLDIDWAPDFIITKVANILIAKNVKATWFLTHTSPIITNLLDKPDLFELGIHPNFMPTSTQGNNQEEILAHCLSLVPNVESMRTHSLMQSTPLLNKILQKTNIKRDSSIYLPHLEGIHPVSYWWKGKKIIRYPIFWEDDLEMDRPDACWTLQDLKIFKSGLKVFNFHPIHIFLNSHDMSLYSKAREKKDLLKIIPSDLSPSSLSYPGSGSLFLEIVDRLASTGNSCCLRDLNTC